MLWSDFSTIDRFYKIEPLNKRFHETLKTIVISLFDERKDDTMVFNEVYYQMTRMAYERALPADLQKYELDIRKGMGSNDAVDLVMSMAYFIMSLVEKDSRMFNSFLLMTIEERYEKCPYWKPFKVLYTRLSKGKRRVTYDFKPRPIPAKEMTNFIPWQAISGDYNAGALLEILSLWKSKDDKRLLFEMISTNVKFSTPKIQHTFYNQVEPILMNHLSEKESSQEVKGSSELEKRIKDLDSTVMMLKKENAVFQNMIKELQADKEKMMSLLEEYKQDGAARKFTFIEIVNYCKDAVEWEDVKEIVNMINVLLRGNATKDDYDLLDSVRAHFKNKKYGNTYIKEQTLIPNVGNYRPEIQTQNVDMKIPPVNNMDQKMLEDE